MANKLADIQVTLTLNDTSFYRSLNKAANSIQGMSKDMASSGANMSQSVSSSMNNVSGSMAAVGNESQAMYQSFNNSLAGVNTNLGYTGKRYRDFYRNVKTYSQLTEEEIKKLPKGLQTFGRELQSTQDLLETVTGKAGRNMDELLDSVLDTKSGFESWTSLSSSGRDAIQVLRDMRVETDKARLAVFGLNEAGDDKLSTEDRTKAFEDFQHSVVMARRDLEDLRESGDFDTYAEGMKQLEDNVRMVEASLGDLAHGGTRVTNTLRELGVITDGVGNSMALRMEKFRDRFIQANNVMQNKTTESVKIMKSIDQLKWHGVSSQLLTISDRLEKNARSGKAFNIALQQLGENAPMKDIIERTKMISKGINRARVNAIYLGIAFGLATWGLVELSNHVDGRLIPAFDELKSVWADALTPFVNAFTTGLLAIMDFVTWIGKLAKSFAETHPQLSQMFWGFMYLFLGLTAILSPLAIGIGLFGGLKAMFAALWPAISSFVTGFLTIAGVSLIIAAAIVVLVAVINNMWKASENFRNAIVNAWTAIKEAIFTALEPVQAKWEELKAKFMELIHTMTGGDAHSMGEFWKWLGDKMAVFVNWFTSNFVPAFQAAFTVVGFIIGLAIDVFMWLLDVITNNFGLIKTIVVSVWDTIGNVIEAGCAIIVNIVDAFKNLFTGNWKGLWNNILAILHNLMKLIWNLVQLWFLGKVLKLVSLFGKGLVKLLQWGLKKSLSVVKSIAKKIWTALKTYFNLAKTAIITIVAGIYTTVAEKFESIKESIIDPIESAKDKVLDIIEKIKSAFSGMKIKIPKPKMPKVSVSKGKGIFGIEYPKFNVNWNAKGNIFNGASVLGGGQGVGEAGAEVVMPIEHSRYMKPFSSSIAAHLAKLNDGKNSQNGSQYNINFNEPVVIREQADIQRIVDEMEKRKRIEERSKGIFSY